MDEFKNSTSEIPPQREFQKLTTWELNTINRDVLECIHDYQVPFGSEGFHTEYTNEREFGIQECSQCAKEIFTKEVIRDWPQMDYRNRLAILQEYGESAAECLGVKSGDIVFKQMKPGEFGYNNGDGNIYLNKGLIEDPRYIILLIDTIAHETRHQYQKEAIQNPEKYGISPEVAKEWEYALVNYTTENCSKYDPWGYHYNPAEIDARYFGETIVREFTKDLINDSEMCSQSSDSQINNNPSFATFFVNDRDWHIKEAERALEKGDMSLYNDHMKSAKISTK